jgi:hypothetical protein
VHVWAAGAFVKLQPGARAARWDGLLVAPRGGRASFQVVVDGGAAAAPRAGAVVAADGARLGGAVSVLRELTVPVTAHSSALPAGLLGAVPDPLVPVTARRQGGSRQVFWVTVGVPRSQRAGLYRGTIAVGDQIVRYRLRVAAVTLPREHALHTWFLVWAKHADAAEHRSGAAEAYTRLLTRYGIGDGSEAGGDAAVGLQPDVLGGDESDADLRRLARGVGSAAAKLRAERPAAVPYSYVYDEPTASQLDGIRRWGAALKRAAPTVRQLVTSPPEAVVGDAVGAWSMHLGALTPGVLATTHELGAEAWVYSSCCESKGSPTLLLDQDAVGNLAVAPATWLQGGAGIVYWSVDDYTGDPYDDARNHGDEPDQIGNGDGVLLYPGRPLGGRSPHPSLRLALTAAGLQIADEAALLARRGHGAEARALLRRVLPATATFVDNPGTWQATERALLQRLERTS